MIRSQRVLLPVAIESLPFGFGLVEKVELVHSARHRFFSVWKASIFRLFILRWIATFTHNMDQSSWSQKFWSGRSGIQSPWLILRRPHVQNGILWENWHLKALHFMGRPWFQPWTISNSSAEGASWWPTGVEPAGARVASSSVRKVFEFVDFAPWVSHGFSKNRLPHATPQYPHENHENCTNLVPHFSETTPSSFFQAETPQRQPPLMPREVSGQYHLWNLGLP